jgi:membrane protease YdiL (CAAX protease family)
MSKMGTPGLINPASQANPMLVLALGALPFLAKAAVLWAGATGYGLQSIYKLFQLVVPCWWRFRRRGARGWRVLWPTDEPLPDARTWTIAVLAAFALAGSGIGTALVVLPLIGLDPHSIRSGLDNRFAVGTTGAVGVWLLLSVVNSALEELHFRAWLDRELTLRWGSAAGVGVSAGAFGAMHVLIFLGELPARAVLGVAAALGVAGAVWSLIMRRPGGIHAAWLSHGLTDALLLGWGLHWLGYV